MNSYRTFSDKQIEQKAQYEVEKLKDEDVVQLKAEIEKRNLSKRLLEAIDIQRNGETAFDFFEHVSFIRNLPCPHCGKTEQPINITRKAQVVSFLIFTGYDKLLTVGCPDCIIKNLEKASQQSRYLGWWSVTGPARTLQALKFNEIQAYKIVKNEPTEDLIKFAYANRGFIIANIENEDELKSLINSINS